MTGRHSYDALVALLEELGNSDPQQFFSSVKLEYGLAHVAYADLLPAVEGYRVHRLLHDPNKALAAYIVEHGLSPLTLLFDAIFQNIGPLEIGQGSPYPLPVTVRRFLAECELLPFAVFFPLAAPPGRKAFFSVHGTGGMDSWQTLRRQLVRDIPSLAVQFCTKYAAARPPATGRPEVRLTPREREVLGWAAAGKSYWEIGKILGISERTVRHFMARVRDKLDAVSNKQAVAEGILRGLISRS